VFSWSSIENTEKIFYLKEPMLTRLRTAARLYPRQFWLLFSGMLISTIGSSMIWPFLTIYLSKRLELPLLTVTSLFTVNAIVDLLFSFVAGPMVDRVGRKRVMVFSLVGNGLVNVFMANASSLPMFALLMALNGAVNPLYRIGADAMMADLIAPEQRPEAYSLLRMGNNLGISLGPMLGGFVAAASYSTAFFIAASGLIFYGLMLAFLAKETLVPALSRPRFEPLGGYANVVKDRFYLSFVGAIAVNTIVAAMMWQLMAVYANANYGIPENQYGFLPTTNALMVVLFQFMVTRITKRYPPLYMIALGAFIYAASAATVSLASGFGGFWISMVVMTVGELILVPTATTLVANRAPADMRGRYMSLYSLTWSVARGIGPAYGGFLNDRLGPKFIWYGGFLVGLLSVTWLMLLSRKNGQPVPSKATL
jgi:MFS family permease